jgi:hypothetical protein
MERGGGRRIAGAVALLLAAASANAQVITGTILGTVTDDSGTALPGATVVVRNVDSGESRRSLAGLRGDYRVAGLGLGTYEVRAENGGFRATVRTGIALTVGREAVVDLRLSVGGLPESLVVEGEAPLVNTTQSAIGHLMDGQAIRDLPLNGRDYTQLILLVPGVTLSRASADSANVGRGLKLSVAGARPTQNLFTLDGTDYNDALNTTPSGAQGLMTGVESIQEFQVLTSTMSAEHGRAAGGVFNVVTRSGANDLHGSAFEFYRDDSLDARNYFDDVKPPFWRHQFGLALGGPVARDRTFFFVSYEGLRESKGVTQVAAVPDLAARSGQLPGRPPIAVDPLVVPYLDLFPEPNGPPILDADGAATGLAEFRGVLDRDSQEDFALARLDHRFSAQDSLSLRYVYGDSTLDEPVNLPAFPNIVRHRRHALTLEERHVFSPSVLNELRIGFNRTRPSEDINPVDPYEDIAFVPGAAIGELLIGGGATAAGTDRTNPKRFHQDLFQIADNVFIASGRHAFKAGFTLDFFRHDGLSESRSRGQLRFRSLEDFLRGRTRDFQVALAGSDFTRHFSQELFGVYVQDDFRVTPRLTLNLGLRYEFVTTPRERDGEVSSLRSIDDPAVTVGAPLFENPSGKGVAPRVGFAWKATADGRTAVRGGFGVFYEPLLFFHYRNPVFRMLPFVSRAVVSRPPLPVDPSQATAEGPLETEAFVFEPRAAKSYQYNLVVQRDLGRDTALTVAYVGSHGVDLFGQGDANTAIPEIRPDGAEFFPEGSERRNPNFLTVDSILQGFRSDYDGLQVAVARHGARGPQLQLSYTLGSARDNRSGSGGRQEFVNGQARTFDPYDFDKDLGPSDFDVRHSLAASVSYDLPLGQGRLREGWRVNAIATCAAGMPFSPIIPGDPDRDASDSNVGRPNVAPGASTEPDGGRTANRWYDPAAFSFPEPGTRGNAGRNSLRGPSLALVDLSLQKTTTLSGRWRLQVRAEVFNLLNRANFDLPLNDEDGAAVFDDQGTPNPTAGRITRTVTDAREVQVAVKLLF